MVDCFHTPQNLGLPPYAFSDAQHGKYSCYDAALAVVQILSLLTHEVQTSLFTFPRRVYRGLQLIRLDGWAVNFYFVTPMRAVWTPKFLSQSLYGIANKLCCTIKHLLSSRDFWNFAGMTARPCHCQRNIFHAICKRYRVPSLSPSACSLLNFS